MSLAYLAKVNDEVITVEDFKKALSSAHRYAPLRKDKAGKLSKKIIKETLDNMIEHYLLAQEAQRLNLAKEPDYLKNLEHYKKDLATLENGSPARSRFKASWAFFSLLVKI